MFTGDEISVFLGCSAARAICCLAIIVEITRSLLAGGTPRHTESLKIWETQ